MNSEGTIQTYRSKVDIKACVYICVGALQPQVLEELATMCGLVIDYICLELVTCGLSLLARACHSMGTPPLQALQGHSYLASLNLLHDVLFKFF
jgi:hypothetical protein